MTRALRDVFGVGGGRVMGLVGQRGGGVECKTGGIKLRAFPIITLETKFLISEQLSGIL